jgi:hypothetical protein
MSRVEQSKGPEQGKLLCSAPCSAQDENFKVKKQVD